MAEREASNVLDNVAWSLFEMLHFNSHLHFLEVALCFTCIQGFQVILISQCNCFCSFVGKMKYVPKCKSW